ncbi:UNVERIFIED_CONTAM: hypothetical protein Sradi_6552900 [Sesamum radiatum]|uniref:Uncharacterized protein n=1 Tax=Sesamum radiatum TaxID=300843 RepID=A0AAW2JZC8_SESRA
MASSYEFFGFVREVSSRNDPSKATSGWAVPSLSDYAGGWRWSLKQAVVVAHRVLDGYSDEEERVG